MQNCSLVATRKSPLALEQANRVCAWLSKEFPSEHFKKLEVSTEIDERLDWSVEERGGIGLFTKELESALSGNQASLAVHSAKDMPTTDPDGLSIAGYLPRAIAHDVLIYRDGCATPKTIATSSPRRLKQIAKLFPNAKWKTIRGNVGTRLKKIVELECEATILAAAGLQRLGISSYKNLIFRNFELEEVVPAPGQGAIAVQCRTSDLSKYNNLFCTSTQIAVEMEKGFLRRLGSGCQIPVGAYYNKGSFRIFHPNTGYRIFELELGKREEIEPALDKLMAELKV